MIWRLLFLLLIALDALLFIEFALLLFWCCIGVGCLLANCCLVLRFCGCFVIYVVCLGCVDLTWSRLVFTTGCFVF